MKKTFVALALAVLFTGTALYADEALIMDFTALDADCCADENGNPTENSRTVMDFAVAAGATFTEDQKRLMKVSLALPNWEVQLNSSAQNVVAVGLSHVVAAPVKGDADVPFAGKNVMGVRVMFPEWNSNANARIVPPFEIPAFEPYSEADSDGNRGEPDKSRTRTLFESDPPGEDDEPGHTLTPAYGVVKNVGAIKSIAVTTMGMNYPEGLYVLLKDNDGVERRYFMGYLGFDGWKELKWSNPAYIADIRNREIHVYPIYPRGIPYVKFVGFLITRDAAHIGGDFIGYFKDVKIIYDKAVLITERDIADEDLWGIVQKREAARQAIEMERFGNKQVNRYLEKVKQTKLEEFTSSLNEGGSSNAAR